MLTDYDDLIKTLSGNMPTLILYKGQIGEILMQYFVRNINGQEYKLFGIWNIDIHPEYRGQGYFKKIIETLENSSYNVCVNNIVNDDVLNFLKKRNWSFVSFQKEGYGEVLMSYRIK